MIARMFCLLLTVLAFSVPAQADSTLFTYSSETAVNVYYACEEFTGELPEQLQEALAGRLWANDQVIGGALCSQYLRSEPDAPDEIAALVAVRRQGKILLFGAKHQNGTWHAVLETDSFLKPDQAFSVKTLPLYNLRGEIERADPAIVADGEQFHLFIMPDGSVNLSRYRLAREDGSAFELEIGEGRFAARVYSRSELVLEERAEGLIPRRLCAWMRANVPANAAQMRAYAALNPVILKEDEAVIYGVNFREQPTTKSHSMGIYTARARLLEKKSGGQFPWYHVAVGDTQGWVSGTYVLVKGTREDQINGNMSQVLPVARTDREIALAQEPGGSGKMLLSADTMMHVVSESDGWLHVIVPRDTLTWKTDWDGTYGYVRREDVLVGLSRAEVKW